MKKVHVVLLVVTAVMALFSAYSLGAMNQIYNINYEWYSQYNSKYSEEYRDTSTDKWHLQEYPDRMKLLVLGAQQDLKKLGEEQKNGESILPAGDFSKYIFLYCSFGRVSFPEYKIKVIDIAQRGNAIEVKVSVNSPEKLDSPNEGSKQAYEPKDIIRIDRRTFPVKGKLYFIFKTQDGNQIGEQTYDVY